MIALKVSGVHAPLSISFRTKIVKLLRRRSQPQRLP
jgi:hypothetical protein